MTIVQYFEAGSPSLRVVPGASDLAKLAGARDLDDQLVALIPSVIPSTVIDALTEPETWLVDCVEESLHSLAEWWYRTPDMTDAVRSTTELIARLRSRQNLVFTNVIRTFGDVDSSLGSAEWLSAFLGQIPSSPFSDALAALLSFFEVAAEQQLYFCIEKIAGCVNSREEPSATLTPHAHRDGNYGYLESVVLPIYSRTRFPMSSTLYLPTVNFEALGALKPLTADKLVKLPAGVAAYACQAGDLAVFSGKKARGEKDDRVGALHISPEDFINTERLALLIRLRHGR